MIRTASASSSLLGGRGRGGRCSRGPCASERLRPRPGATRCRQLRVGRAAGSQSQSPSRSQTQPAPRAKRGQGRGRRGRGGDGESDKVRGSLQSTRGHTWWCNVPNETKQNGVRVRLAQGPRPRSRACAWPQRPEGHPRPRARPGDSASAVTTQPQRLRRAPS